MNLSLRSSTAAQALRNAWGWYSKTLDRHPIKTKMVTTFTIFTTADITRQRLENRPTSSPPFPLSPPADSPSSSPTDSSSIHALQAQSTVHPLPSFQSLFPEWYDWFRTARLAGFYSLVNAPWVHTTNFLYDTLLGKRVYTIGVLTRTVCDMCFFMPLFMSCMLPSQALLAGHSLEVAKKHTEDRILPLLQGAWMCFIPVSLFNFIFIQTKFRVLTLNMTQLGFGVYVSKMANSVASEKEEGSIVEQQLEIEEKRSTTEVDVTTAN